MACAAFLSITRPMLNFHALRFSGPCLGRVQQSLRHMFYLKLTKANYTFSFISDSALVSKIMLVDIDAVAKIMVVIPNLLASIFAVIFILAFIIMSLDFGIHIWIVLAVFLVGGTFVGILSFIIIRKKRIMNYSLGRRTQILTELLPNIINIKLHSLENFFVQKMDTNRVLEIKNTRAYHFFLNLSNFFFFASPLLASLAAVWVFNLLRPD